MILNMSKQVPVLVFHNIILQAYHHNPYFIISDLFHLNKKCVDKSTQQLLIDFRTFIN